MAEIINTNVFDATKKFVDFAGLDYFWDKAKAYVDGVDTAMAERVKAAEDAITAINDELDSLSGGAGSIQTQISNAISALDLPNTYDSKGAAATAESNAKAYADGLAKNYDSVGSASAAETAAKAYADGLDTAMDTRVKVLEAIDHSKLAEDAAASAVATVLDGAPESFDTLKEVAAWIADNSHAQDVAGLLTDVANLKAIDHDAYVEADKTVLASAKAYADGLAKNYDAAGAAATAESNAKAYADGKFQIAGNYEAAGAADAALAAAKADAAEKYQVKGNYDAAGAAATAESNAKAYADGLAKNYDAAGAAATAESNAKAYADGLAKNYDAAGAASAAQAAAIAQAKLDAAQALESYYTSKVVDNLLSTNSEGDRAYAKQYTDELFTSVKFASVSDIDGLFA